jgi:protein SCO1/2
MGARETLAKVGRGRYDGRMEKRRAQARPLLAALTMLLAQGALAPRSSADDEDRHAHHQADEDESHAHHQGTESDPHAHHRAMMNKPPATKRSVAKYEIPKLIMIDQNGHKVPLRKLFDTDRPVMVNFIFTTCTAICPMMTSIFQQVQTRLGDDAKKVLMVSVSIDPEEDTPEALAKYAKQFDAGPQWTFLTGSLEDSIAVQKALNAYRGDKSNHAPLTLLRDNKQSDWVRLDGFASASELERECRSML